MTTESIIAQISMQSHLGLPKVYEGICEIYRQRLIEQWEIDPKQCWWIPSDRIGEVIAVNDLEFSFGMEELRLIVDNCISYESFNEWWQYILESPMGWTISAYNWLVKGIRPEDICRQAD